MHDRNTCAFNNNDTQQTKTAINNHTQNKNYKDKNTSKAYMYIYIYTVR